MKRTGWAWGRLAVGIALLFVLIRQLGPDAFLQGLRSVDGWSLVWAAGIAVVATVSSAWRWGLVGRGLGVTIPLRHATAAYYRSQFLNVVLPGGVLGDVHRAVGHGREVGDVGRGLRAVSWERTAGQAVQVMITLVVLVALPSPARIALPIVVAGVVGFLCLAMLSMTRPGGNDTSRFWRIWRAARNDLHHGLLASKAWPGVAVASLVVVACHTATFLLAARTAGVTASATQLLPLALLVLLAMAVPISVGGWGPREGAAAWLFAAAGLGAAQGVAAATAYGVLTLVATLPGGIVLILASTRRTPACPEATSAHRGPLTSLTFGVVGTSRSGPSSTAPPARRSR